MKERRHQRRLTRAPAAASLFAIGYGRHETEPSRVLPFYPVFLAGMNLVVLADDAFSFLVSWEFMSLASWALVVAHPRWYPNLSDAVRRALVDFATRLLASRAFNPEAAADLLRVTG